MKIDDIVLVCIAVLIGCAALAYLIALLIGVIATGGLMLPVLVAFLGVCAVFFVVVRQRITNREDDHYDKIER